MAKDLNAENFDQSISTGLVLVDLWASWCGPCRMLAPTIDELESEYSGKLLVCKVDVDECPDIAARFNVYSIPTLLLFKDGELADRSIGFKLKRELEALIQKYL